MPAPRLRSVPPLVIPAAAAAHPGDLTLEALAEQALFRGVLETVVSPLGVNAEGVLWTARSAVEAQTYIPAAGGRALVHLPRASELDDMVRPECDIHVRVAAALGFTLEVLEADAIGRPMRWCWQDATGAVVASPRQRAVAAYLTETLGYTPTDHGAVWVKVTGVPTTLLPADYRAPGSLFVLLPQEPLRIYDHAWGREGDLTDPEHLHQTAFAAADAAGCDGIRINDFLQSPAGGNVPHESIGLFARGAAKVTLTIVPAVHADAGARDEVAGVWPAPITPDLRAAHAALVRERGAAPSVASVPSARPSRRR